MRRLSESRSVWVHASAAEAFTPIRRIGGEVGWYGTDVLWRMRGAFDQLFGGRGVRRGRRDPENLVVGDAVDFWRVEAVETDCVLRLVAEMKLPGTAWLQFEVEGEGEGARIRQVSEFEPTGLVGTLYWYGVCPMHALVFRRMLAGIAAGAEEEARRRAATSQ